MTTFVTLNDFSKGVINKRQNPLNADQRSIIDGLNCELTGKHLTTRKGFTLASSDLPNGEVQYLTQVRFPMNEVSFLVAQVGLDTNPWSEAASGLSRSDHASCWDAENARMWTYGGGQDMSYFDQVAGAWTDLTTTGGPTVNITRHALIWDGAGDRLILFGGYDDGAYRNWVYEYVIATNTWNALSPTGTAPSIRSLFASAHDTEGRRLFVSGGKYGGSSYRPWSPFYVLDLSTLIWTEVTGAGAPSLYWAASKAIFDTVNNQWIMFGGQSDEAYTHDCYAIDGITGAWTQLADVIPGTYDGMTGHTAIYCNGKILAMWGAVIVDETPATTWDDCLYEYDIETDVWTHITGSDEHPGDDNSWGTAVVTDSGDIILYGGTGAGGDVWQLDNYCSSGMGAMNRLYASPDHLPVTVAGTPPDGAEFTQIYDLGADADVISSAVLNDRAIFTEGESVVPLVWGGAMDDTTDPPTDWLYPKTALISQDGVNFYDVTQYVTDSDSDSVADVGGILANGYLAVCSDLPQVKGFYFEMQTPNEGIEGNPTYTGTISLTTLADVARLDLRNTLTNWVQDAGATGHFEDDVAAPVTIGPGNTDPDVIEGVVVLFEDGSQASIISITDDGESSGETELSSEIASQGVTAIYGVDILANMFNLSGDIDQYYQDLDDGHFEGVEKDLDNSAVVNLNNGRVSLPATSHGMSSGDYIRVYGTTSYDAIYMVEASSTTNAIHVTVDYVAETFGAGAKFRKCISLGTGNDCPDVVVGTYVLFTDGVLAISRIAQNGDQSEQVTLEEPHATGTVSAIYDPATPNSGISVNHISGTATTICTKTPYSWANAGKLSIRQVLSATDITGDGEGLVSLTIKAGQEGVATSNQGYCELSHCSIVERSGSTANGTTTPTPITWKGGQSAVSLAPNEEVTSDDIAFAVDETKDYIVSFDHSYRTIIGYAIWATSGVALSNGAGYYSKVWDLTDTNACFDKQTVTGFSSLLTGCQGVIKLETKPLQPLPTDVYVAHTTDSSQFDISIAEDFVGVEAIQTQPGSTVVYHLVSFDARQTFSAWSGSAWFQVVQLSGGNWQYKNAGSAWANSSPNSLLGALKQAFAVTANQMTAAELEAITSTQWKSSGGVTVKQGSLDFAVALQYNGVQYPTVNGYTITYGDAGTTIVEGWRSGAWDEGDYSWTDDTRVGDIPLAQSGKITYGGQYYQGEYQVLSEVPGYWWRFRTNGTSAGTAISRILIKAPCQPLSSIGPGQPDIPMQVLYQYSTTAAVRDISVELSDNIITEQSIAEIPMTVNSSIYIGSPTKFFGISCTPWVGNSQAAEAVVEFWNGQEYEELTAEDSTSASGRTLATKGMITWTISDSWRMHIPFPGDYTRAYWIRLSVSAPLHSDTALSELRVYGQPDALTKHRYVETIQNRIALACRSDAKDQVDESAPLAEYTWTGPNAGAWRVGGTDSIQAMIAAWNLLLVAKAQTWHIQGPDGNFAPAEGLGFTPLNNRVLVKAPLPGSDGSRAGLYLINQQGAYVITGMQADSNFATFRAVCLSDGPDFGVRWWDKDGDYDRLDFDYLARNACGVYWPERSWVIWSVPMALEGVAQTTNNRLIIYDLSLAAWLPPFDISVSALCTANLYNTNAPGKLGHLALYGGRYDGTIIRLFDSETDAGVAIDAWVQTPYLSFNSPEEEKRITDQRVIGKTTGTKVDLEVRPNGLDDLLAGYTHEFTKVAGLASNRQFAMDSQVKMDKANFFEFTIRWTGPSDIYALVLGIEGERDRNLGE